ncbi:YabP family protein [Oxobacter pfennigii]|uniref:YabP family protein n=1 Tax=Oxobacter pfennigii TaxID=36849 RepID=A0A0P8W8R2_9CLOT|nr:sporulation protein YqfC [Oxobacter pfennigii]KPU44114.1 YabP family protein [Oxobacter pfennigii]
MAKKTQEVKQQIAGILGFPKDVVMNTPKATMTGNIQVNIENHLGLIQYEDKIVRINTSIGVYTITGLNLVIKDITTDEISIAGLIENLDISG